MIFCHPKTFDHLLLLYTPILQSNAMPSLTALAFVVGRAEKVSDLNMNDLFVQLKFNPPNETDD